MKLSKDFKIFLLIILGVFIAAWPWWFNYLDQFSYESPKLETNIYESENSKSNIKFIRDNSGPTETIPITGSNWSIYRQFKYGIQFEYPTTWSKIETTIIRQADKSDIVVFSVYQSVGSGVFTVTVNKDVNLKQTINEVVSMSKNKLISNSQKNISGKMINELKWQSVSDGSVYSSYVLTSNRDTITIGPATVDNAYIINRVVSSLVTF